MNDPADVFNTGDAPPAACLFCGAETRDGLMVFPEADERPNVLDTWPVCIGCMRAAVRRGQERGTRPVLAFDRSPN